MDTQLLQVGWRNLGISEFVKLCQSNKTFAALCRQPSTWQYLLQRDFGIVSKSDEAAEAKKEYFKQLIDLAIDATLKYVDSIENFMRKVYADGKQLKPEHEIDLLNGISFQQGNALSGLGKDKKFGTLLGNRVGMSFIEEVINLRKDNDLTIENDLDALLEHIRFIDESIREGYVGLGAGELDYLNE